MTRETAQERKIKQAELVAKRELEYKIHQENYFKDLPRRLLELTALAKSLNVTADVELSLSGPKIRFYYSDRANNHYIDDFLSYQSDEHDVVEVEYFLKILKDEYDARIFGLNLAKNALNKLTADEQAALKKYIEYIS